uniref:AP2/ERF domain-containing protein n=1 Tax=Chromera velia CCMP2878 TaxID=1169474 RepID=A0A0G4HU42_9ALVE|eukprot:Cvel_8538.t1-p1 / transcript=Cvel_8538.t1 / gene=Cvel_8538 / organism=Chromera_velia_CCMP2878 / gene_product=hypothetical protein / transcript_product=hypothetical protein / location=Cvel_scaffold473:44075-50303(-) / protein_length=1133 / sequence_SO=supercontig / SO=protein_coding / is_pseudo=false
MMTALEEALESLHAKEVHEQNVLPGSVAERVLSAWDWSTPSVTANFPVSQQFQEHVIGWRPVPWQQFLEVFEITDPSHPAKAAALLAGSTAPLYGIRLSPDAQTVGQQEIPVVLGEYTGDLLHSSEAREKDAEEEKEGHDNRDEDEVLQKPADFLLEFQRDFSLPKAAQELLLVLEQENKGPYEGEENPAGGPHAKGKEGFRIRCRHRLGRLCFVQDPSPPAWLTRVLGGLGGLQEKEPNCEFRLVWHNGWPRVFLVARPDAVIPPGTELTAHQGRGVWDRASRFVRRALLQRLLASSWGDTVASEVTDEAERGLLKGGGGEDGEKASDGSSVGRGYVKCAPKDDPVEETKKTKEEEPPTEDDEKERRLKVEAEVSEVRREISDLRSRLKELEQKEKSLLSSLPKAGKTSKINPRALLKQQQEEQQQQGVKHDAWPPDASLSTVLREAQDGRRVRGVWLSPGSGPEHAEWVANWVEGTRKTKRKFPVSRFGEEGARMAAIASRFLRGQRTEEYLRLVDDLKSSMAETKKKPPPAAKEGGNKRGPKPRSSSSMLVDERGEGGEELTGSQKKRRREEVQGGEMEEEGFEASSSRQFSVPPGDGEVETVEDSSAPASFVIDHEEMRAQGVPPIPLEEMDANWHPTTGGVRPESGLTGVYFHHGPRPGTTGAWVANWCADGRQERRRIPIAKEGMEGSFWTAVRLRLLNVGVGGAQGGPAPYRSSLASQLSERLIAKSVKPESGVTGVWFNRPKASDPLDMGGWVANWCEAGRQVKKRFAVRTHGMEVARQLAIELRATMAGGGGGQSVGGPNDGTVMRGGAGEEEDDEATEEDDTPPVSEGGTENKTGPRQGAGVRGVHFKRTEKAWVAVWMENGKQNKRSFSCAEAGGFNGARRAAIAFRRKKEREMEQPDMGGDGEEGRSEDGGSCGPDEMMGDEGMDVDEDTEQPVWVGGEGDGGSVTRSAMPTAASSGSSGSGRVLCDFSSSSSSNGRVRGRSRQSSSSSSRSPHTKKEENGEESMGVGFDVPPPLVPAPGLGEVEGFVQFGQEHQGNDVVAVSSDEGSMFMEVPHVKQQSPNGGQTYVGLVPILSGAGVHMHGGLSGPSHPSKGGLGLSGNAGGSSSDSPDDVLHPFVDGD